MDLKFEIVYHTEANQYIAICTPDGARMGMKAVSQDLWQLTVPEGTLTANKYKYEVVDGLGTTVVQEFGDWRVLSLPPSRHTVHLKDWWRSTFAEENLLYTAPFRKAFFKRKVARLPKFQYDQGQAYIRFQIHAPRIAEGYQLALLGSSTALGAWDSDCAVLMNGSSYPLWSVDIPVDGIQGDFEYKYLIYSHKEKRIVTWEYGDNRHYTGQDEADMVVWTDEAFRYPVGTWKAVGVAIPVFSLRSDNGTGVGEFVHIRQMVDWASKVGIKIVQVLPVNDTVATHTWKDSYPYAAISVDALHPIYGSMYDIGPLKNKKAQKELMAEAFRLNAMPEVDYEAVMKMKSRFYKLSYDENKEDFLGSKAFKDFLKANKNWIYDYAAFSFLRDKYGTVNFQDWGAHQSMSDRQIKQLTNPGSADYDDIAVHYYIQYHLDRQLKEASGYARSKGVVLKGDIPIGIYRYSVEAWRQPSLFHMDSQSGAPPDDFSITGQNWGFPTYNWEEMQQDGYQWWRDRMVKMADYFDVFRIDHILGFFRIWEIPLDHVQGLLGHFNPSLPYHEDELRQWGLAFDHDRLCRPYIRRHMLEEWFGEDSSTITDTYLMEGPEGNFSFKQDFDTQRKLKNYFQKNEVDASILEKLYALHAEVLFLPADRPGMFHPRINFHETYSFQELDGHARGVLDRLHAHYFYHKHNDFWRESAMQKLPMLKGATDMLICGEDLGMVPKSVPGVMKDLQILSLAIQRMPNDEREFWHPADTSYLSVTSTGSHDMSNLREWWEEDYSRSERFYHQILGLDGAVSQHCTPELARLTIGQHFRSPSMLAILPLQDFLAMDENLRRDNPFAERINVPANPEHYWRYRMHLSIEQLNASEDFNTYLHQMIDGGGRYADY